MIPCSSLSPQARRVSVAPQEELQKSSFRPKISKKKLWQSHWYWSLKPYHRLSYPLPISNLTNLTSPFKRQPFDPLWHLPGTKATNIPCDHESATGVAFTTLFAFGQVCHICHLHVDAITYIEKMVARYTHRSWLISACCSERLYKGEYLNQSSKDIILIPVVFSPLRIWSATVSSFQTSILHCGDHIPPFPEAFEACLANASNEPIFLPRCCKSMAKNNLQKPVVPTKPWNF